MDLPVGGQLLHRRSIPLLSICSNIVPQFACHVNFKYISAKEFHNVSCRPVIFREDLQKDKNIPVLGELQGPYSLRKY